MHKLTANARQGVLVQKGAAHCPPTAAKTLLVITGERECISND